MMRSLAKPSAGLAEMPEKEWRPAVERVADFSARLKEPADRFEEAKWKQVNEEIAKFRQKVTDRG